MSMENIWIWQPLLVTEIHKSNSIPGSKTP